MSTATDREHTVAAFVLLVPLYLFDAWVVTRMWRWFIVPLGVPALTLAHAVGVGALAALLTHQHRVSEEKADVLKQVSSNIAVAAVALLVGFVASRFMEAA